jgi:hypothetical protein
VRRPPGSTPRHPGRCRSSFRYPKGTTTSWLSIAGCITLAALVALVAAVSGCGGGAPAAQAGGATGREGRPPSAKPDRAPRGGPAGGSCRRQVGDFIGSMETLRRSLAVGVSYEEYEAKLRTVRSAYRRVPVKRMTLGCLASVGTPAEKALARYIDAANSWGECLSEAGCASVSIEADLQARWRVASRHLSEAQRGL